MNRTSASGVVICCWAPDMTILRFAFHGQDHPHPQMNSTRDGSSCLAAVYSVSKPAWQFDCRVANPAAA